VIEQSYELPPEAEAKLEALRAAQAQRNAEAELERLAKRNLWLTHHWADEYDRCAVLGGRHVCRRCLTLYPIALTVMALSFVGLAPWPESLDPILIWLLCIPATLEFLAEKLGDVRYAPRRQVVVTAAVGLALGRGLAHEVDDRWSWLFWGPVLVFGTAWFLAALVKAQRTMMEKALEGSVEYDEPQAG
jgi:hypothetical protein